MVIDDKLRATEKILDNKLVVLVHYDQHLSQLDRDVQDARQLAHDFRDALKIDFYDAK